MSEISHQYESISTKELAEELKSKEMYLQELIE